MVTLRDVALRAGVSVRTVSNVVNQYEHVADRTRARVQAVIDQMGYKPNLAARHLRGGRTGLLRLGVPNLDNRMLSRLADEAIRVAQDRGYTVIIERTEGDAEAERQLVLGTALRRLRTDGLLLCPFGADLSDTLRELPEDGPPVVLIARVDTDTVDSIFTDYVGAGREAAGHLIGLGRRRIGLLGLKSASGYDGVIADRMRGIRAALDEAGLPADESFAVVADAAEPRAGAQATSVLLDRVPDLDGVIGVTDLLAMGALDELRRRGRSVPEDVAVLGFDDHPAGQFTDPPLTSVSPDPARVARIATDLLVDRIEGRLLPTTDRPAPHRVEVRGSTVTVTSPL